GGPPRGPPAPCPGRCPSSRPPPRRTVRRGRAPGEPAGRKTQPSGSRNRVCVSLRMLDTARRCVESAADVRVDVQVVEVRDVAGRQTVDHDHLADTPCRGPRRRYVSRDELHASRDNDLHTVVLPSCRTRITATYDAIQGCVESKASPGIHLTHHPNNVGPPQVRCASERGSWPSTCRAGVVALRVRPSANDTDVVASVRSVTPFRPAG